MVSTDKTCFVIQPFCEPYNKRFNDAYKPAIESAGLTPVRVDLNPGARNLVEEIHRGIRDAHLCFAEISSDNPNVWYELGYAFALGKSVVMVCEEGQRTKLPFDIGYNHVIFYQTASVSDFSKLRDSITAKLNAFKCDIKTEERIIDSPLQDIGGLKHYESALLALIVGDQKIPQDTSPVQWISTKMAKVGFNDTATSIAFRLLSAKGFVETFFRPNEYDDELCAMCRLTDKGEEFVLSHTSLFDLSPSVALPVAPTALNQDQTTDFPF